MREVNECGHRLILTIEKLHLNFLLVYKHVVQQEKFDMTYSSIFTKKKLKRNQENVVFKYKIKIKITKN